MELAVGQIWDIYSKKGRRWNRATLVEINEHGVRLKYHASPESCVVESGLLTSHPEQFRFIAASEQELNRTKAQR
jgi:hypothetical protein